MPSPLTPSLGALGALEVDFSAITLLQSGLFVVLVVALKPLLIDPMIRLFEEREKRTEGARKQARAMQERAGELLRKYEAELGAVHRAAAEAREKLRAETARAEAEIMADAHRQVDEVLASGRAALAAETARLRKELDARTQKLGQELSAAVLGREVRA